MAMKTTKQILVEARELIAKGWTQLAYAKKANGDVTDDRDGSGVCFCALGAIRRASGSYTDCQPAAGVFRAAIGSAFIDGWNDAPGRTQAEVLEAFDRAIAAKGGAQ
jgi:hypothetical protein